MYWERWKGKGKKNLAANFLSDFRSTPSRSEFPTERRGLFSRVWTKSADGIERGKRKWEGKKVERVHNPRSCAGNTMLASFKQLEGLIRERNWNESRGLFATFPTYCSRGLGLKNSGSWAWTLDSLKYLRADRKFIGKCSPQFKIEKTDADLIASPNAYPLALEVKNFTQNILLEVDERVTELWFLMQKVFLHYQCQPCKQESDVVKSRRKAF